MPNNEYIEEIEKNVDDEDTSCGIQIRQPFSPSDIKLQTPPMNLGDLIDLIEYHCINFGTDYQRSPNLWSPRQQSRLIESALLGLRLPAFYFEEVAPRKYNIIDGLQRCCAIKNFCVTGELAKLVDLEFLGDEFQQTGYKDFPFPYKREIRMLPITVNILEKGTPNKVKYILFQRLNTGGISLNAQEIRNAIFSGIAIDTVAKMAKDEAFLDVTQNSISDERKQDMDFVSRFVAFYVTDYKKYTPDLENFINISMEKINKGEVDVEKMQADFSRSMLISKQIFGDRAFRKQASEYDRKKPLNKALFEVVSVLFSRLTDEEVSVLDRKKVILKKRLWDKFNGGLTFSNSFSGGTGSFNSVKTRFSETEKIFKTIIEND